MLGSSASQDRPAANPRRSFLFSAALWLLVLGGGTTLSIEACSPPPPWPLEAVARAAVARTLGRIRRLEPTRTRALEEMVTLAEAATAARQTSMPWSRGDWPVEDRWTTALTASTTTLRELVRTRQAQEARWLEVAGPMATDLARAQAEATEPGLGRRVGTALQRAEVLAATAQRYAQQGQYTQAVASAGQAAFFTARVHETFLELHSRFQDRRLQGMWRRWVEETLAEARRRGGPAIIVDKLARRLDVYVGAEHKGTFTAEIGANGLRPKEHAGDKATPEGRYRVTEVRSNGRTKFYKALLLDYPNDADLARFRAARLAGAIPHGVGPGSLIEVHGDGGQGKDWTDGCIALHNRDMDKVFAIAGRVGTPITIVGTH